MNMLAEIQALKKLNGEDPLQDEDFMAAVLPGGIEAQEKRGQTAFVASSMLPRDIKEDDKAALCAAGVIFGTEADDLFVNVQLPQGWRKEATEHSMWSILLDEYGRERASIFYKAAFYDRWARASAKTRFTFDVRPVLGWDNWRDTPWIGVVLDAGKVVFEKMGGKRPSYDETKALAEECRAWLDEKYPDWRNKAAYWDE